MLIVLTGALEFSEHCLKEIFGDGGNVVAVRYAEAFMLLREIN